MAAHSSTKFALTLGVLAVALGCADDGVSMHIVCPIYPEISDTMCTFDASNETCVSTGVMNLAATKRYKLVLRVASGLKPRIREAPVRGETNATYLKSANIELRVPSGERLPLKNAKGEMLPNPYTALTTGYLTPGGSTAALVTIIDEQLSQYLYPVVNGQNRPLVPQIIVLVKIHGETLGKEQVSTDEFTWALQLESHTASECIEIDYCYDLFGQDDYARACKRQ